MLRSELSGLVESAQLSIYLLLRTTGLGFWRFVRISSRFPNLYMIDCMFYCNAEDLSH